MEAKDLGLNAGTLYINPATGSVDTGEGWAADADSWDTTEHSVQEQAAKLEKVDEDEIYDISDAFVFPGE